ncbi:hypothetical protein CBS101457_004464 [Exobasidium rhododendri]|nr:hypothetical protein CBS101457_004464 [Exobasidium rhododendri]
MRINTPFLSSPPSTPGPSNLKLESAYQRSDVAMLQKDHKVQEMERKMSTASAPDYFTSSSEGISSPKQPSRASSITSEHPWANLFPKGAAGAATNMPRVEHMMPRKSIGGMDMSSPSSSSKMPFKMPESVQGMRVGGSGASVSTNKSSSLSSVDHSRFLPIEPLEFAQSLSGASSSVPSKADTTLIIDIRPSTSFSMARILGSMNLCAPSTLLKRAGVTVDRVEDEMLSNEHDQIKFSGWRLGPQKKDSKKIAETTNSNSNATPIERVVVLDSDTAHADEAGKPSSGGGGPCLIGVLRKFDLAGYDGELRWLVGGFNGFSSKVEESRKSTGEVSSDLSPLLDHSSLSKPVVTKNVPSLKGAIPSLVQSDSQRRSSLPSLNKSSPLELRARSSTRQSSLVQPRGLPMEAFSLFSTTRSNQDDSKEESKIGLSNTTIDQSAMNLPNSAFANPFFDNIRQNRELQHGITTKFPLDLPPLSQADLEILPSFLRSLVEMEETKRAEDLAEKFFNIEKAEQRRLMATMQQHAAESNLQGANRAADVVSKAKLLRQASGLQDVLELSSSYSAVKAGENCDNKTKETFPFSIAAALERGSENRYNNIWTYEHSRIRCTDASDYLNGSYIEPGKEFGCRRRYIATQAPLPSTFTTFWAVMWQQNVRTICMVTREFESGRIQSHNYWKDGVYGALSLKLIDEISLDATGKVMQTEKLEIEKDDGGNMFPSTYSKAEEAYAPHIVKRRVQLTQGKEEREIVQLQFVAWPDYSIPDDAESILNYMALANKEQNRADLELKKVSTSHGVGPLVVHCSAGVGRTGTYIVIDSVLDILRKRRRARRHLDVSSVWDDSWGFTLVDSLGKKGAADVKMAGPAANSYYAPSLLTSALPRKSLKRELSPSAMDLDFNDGERRTSQGAVFSYNNNNPTVRQNGGNDSSPPPLQRNRSSDDPAETPTLSSFTFTSPSSTPSSGLETPSVAMGSMKIAWDSPQPPTPTKTTKIAALFPESMMSPGRKEDATIAPMSLDIPATNTTEEDVDLIQKCVEIIREQRMSTVQTGRQYVFAYLAVIEGILREKNGGRGRMQ